VTCKGKTNFARYVTPCERIQNQEEKVAWILHAKAPRKSGMDPACKSTTTRGLDTAMGQLQTFSVVPRQKELLVLKE